MQHVEVLSSTTKRKTVEVNGGFYSEEDMRNELGYKENLGMSARSLRACIPGSGSASKRSSSGL